MHANDYSKIKRYDARYKYDTVGENSLVVIGTSRRVVEGAAQRPPNNHFQIKQIPGQMTLRNCLSLYHSAQAGTTRKVNKGAAEEMIGIPACSAKG